MSAPSFSEVFLDALKLGHQVRGRRAYCPWLLVLCLVPSIALAPYALSHVQASSKGAVILPPVYAAFLVVGGFLGALSINIMSQTVSILSESKFARYLRDIKVFDFFIFWPQMTLGVQISSIMMSLVALIFYFFDHTSQWAAYSAGAAFGLTVYSCLKAWSLIDLVRQLAWHRLDYTTQLEDEIEKIKSRRNPDSE